MKRSPSPRSRSKRRWPAWTRTLHIYTSTFAFLLVLFFGVTGFMLNHPDWFGVEEVVVDTSQDLFPQELLEGELDRLAIVEELRRSEGITGLLSDFETQDDRLRIAFKRPGRQTDVTIDRRDGALELRVESGGLTQLLTQLHKGEGSGSWGGLLIDITSLSLILLSITGLILWFTLKKRRQPGLAAIVLGAGFFVCVSLYVFL